MTRWPPSASGGCEVATMMRAMTAHSYRLEAVGRALVSPSRRPTCGRKLAYAAIRVGRRSLQRADTSVRTSVHHPVLQRLGQMRRLDVIGSGEIGDRPRHLQHAIEAAGAERKAVNGCLQQAMA